MARISVSEHHARLVADTVQYETGMRRAATVSATSAQSMGGSFSRIRGVVGQAGYQIQDFAVQVQGGQSALLAFSQQGSQLLGAFGAGGAIAGAVLTVGVLTAKLWETAHATSEVSKETEALVAAQKRLNEARYDYAFERLDPATQKKALQNQIDLGKAEEERLKKRLAANLEIRRALDGLGALDVIEPGKVKDFGFQPGASGIGKGGLRSFLNEQRDLNLTQIAEIETARVAAQSKVDDLQKESAKEEVDLAEKTAKEVESRYKKKADFLADLEKRNLDARAKTGEEARARVIAREEKERSKTEQAAKDHAAKIDAIENRDRNEYQRRGLQLGAAQNIGAAPDFNRPDPLGFVAPSPALLAPGNAGREDQRVPSLLNSIDATLKLISKKETALA